MPCSTNTRIQKQGVFVLSVAQIEKNKTKQDTLAFFKKLSWNLLCSSCLTFSVKICHISREGEVPVPDFFPLHFSSHFLFYVILSHSFFSVRKGLFIHCLRRFTSGPVTGGKVLQISVSHTAVTRQTSVTLYCLA